MGVDYGWEKFFNSLHYAIADTSPLPERLRNVVLGVSHLQRESFPNDETWERFQKFMTGNTMIRAKGDEGTIRSTTSRMNDDEASQWLQEALAIFSSIAEGCGREQPER